MGETELNKTYICKMCPERVGFRKITATEENLQWQNSNQKIGYGQKSDQCIKSFLPNLHRKNTFGPSEKIISVRQK